MIIILLLLMMSAIAFIIIYQMRRYILLKQRLERLVLPFARESGGEDLLSRQDLIKKRYFVIAKKFLNHFNLLTPDATKVLVKRLANAGWLTRNALIAFLNFQIISLFAGFFLAILVNYSVPYIASKSVYIRMGIMIALVWLGYRFPDLYLSNRIKAYRQTLRRSILEFFDLFLICIEAGYGNDKALERVTSEFSALHPHLCEQARFLITELRILPNRNVAWDNFAERTGVEEIKVVVQIIKQSEKLGASMGQALRAQMEMLRSERLSLVEQKAMRLPTLLTIPLVLFIFPSLLIVLLGPAILSAMEAFSNK